MKQSTLKIKRDKIVHSLQLTTAAKIPRYKTFPGVGSLIGIPGMLGDIIFNKSASSFYGHNGQTWVPFGADSGDLKSDGTVPMAANFNLDSNKIIGLAAPTAGTDATNKTYVDSLNTPIADFITVAQTGGDYTTIAAAITAAGLLTPSVTNPVGILVYPGVYTEANPLTTAPYIDITAVTGSHTVIVKPVTLTSEIFNISNESNLRGFNIRGATGVGGIGVKVSSTAGSHAHIQDCSILDCETGIQITGASTDAEVSRCHIHQITGDIIQTGIEILAGAKGLVEYLDINLGGGGTSIPKGIKVDGTGSTLTTNDLMISNCIDGIFLSNDGDITTAGTFISTCTYGIHIDVTNGTLLTTSLRINNSTTYDIWAEGTGSAIEGSGVILENSKIEVNTSSILNLTYISPTDGDRNFTVTGEFHTGAWNRPTESVFGKGDSTVLTMNVFWNANLAGGVWTDQTVAASSATGSTFNAFPAVTTNSTLYFGGDWAFPGIKIESTQVITLGSGALVWEYWNGAWTVFKLMTALSGSPFTQNAENVFATISNSHVRFGEMTGWVKSTLNATNKYWVRVRISSAITTRPIIERIKLHVDRTEINESGNVIFFGEARPTADLPIQLALGGIKDVDVQFSSNILMEYKDNGLQDGNLHNIGLTLPISAGIDTSFDATISVYWICTVPTGDVELQFRYVSYGVGDTVGALTETSGSTVITLPGTKEVIQKTDFTIDISSLIASDSIVFQLVRDATVTNTLDTAAGDVGITKFEIHGRTWILI